MSTDLTIYHPTLNALLNAASAVFLCLGVVFIRKGNQARHKMCMIGALTTSVIFLISYLAYHSYHGVTRFTHTGFLRTVYFSVLLSHTVLAVVIVPLILRTLILAVKGRYDTHKKWARITFPLWLYVSITGVVVYFMLYHMDS